MVPMSSESIRCFRMGAADCWCLILTTMKKEQRSQTSVTRTIDGWKKWIPCGRLAGTMEFRALSNDLVPGVAVICGYSLKAR